jgi:cytochrome c-type biogenesis protein CcmE|tara:strand:- start:4283 stop:4705 length:423 start_codon:yes stop_codon:yes gene_type:complete
MFGKKVKSRILFISLLLFSLVLLTYFFFKALEDNVIYFKSPSEIKNISETEMKKKIRVGGMVKTDSIKSYSDYISFTITDFKSEINVTYSGSIPNLFSEGKGVVAEGILKDKNYFIASKILAKHDENYMPPNDKNLNNNK